jgi:hypothetical protein
VILANHLVVPLTIVSGVLTLASLVISGIVILRDRRWRR